MKKVILFITMLFTLFIFDTKILGDTSYNYYYKLTNNNKIKLISNVELLNKNEYYKENYSSFIKETEDYLVKNKSDLINVYYSAINNGFENLTFYCDDSYIACFNDINSLDNENDNFSYINQLVNVYNTYSSIESTYSSNNRVDIKINKKYSKETIDKINDEINRVLSVLDINKYSDIREKIKVIHDYLANNNTYDNDKDNGTSSYNSDSAYGALFEGKAICSGYTDAMSLFLDKLSIPNTRLASENHVWNIIKIGETWYHLDLTWDDPVTSNGTDVIIYDYFLITTDELKSKDDDEHNINMEVYNFVK